MFEIIKHNGLDKTQLYSQINTYLHHMINGEPDWLAGLSNASALLYFLMPDINWAGFYLCRGEELVLGPFQGKPACVRIPFGRGVCGTAAKLKETQIVPDVNQFPGHIACDSESRSEIVVPVIKNGELIGVLDIDSSLTSRFSREDAEGLAKFVEILVECLDWPELR